MKTHTLNTQKSINQPLSWRSSFQSTFTSSVLYCLWAWQQLQGAVMKALSRIKVFVDMVTLTIQNVWSNHRQLFQTNRRHVLGVVLLMAGVVGFYSGLFFDPQVFDHAPCQLFDSRQCYNFETQEGWCLLSWSLYFDNIGWAVGLLFWSVAGLMFVPPKFTLSYIPFSLFHAVAWVKILHVTFFARSFETYNAFPAWQIIFIAVMLGFGIVMSADAVVYNYNHRTLAIEKRLGTLYNGLDLLDGETFKAQYKKFYEQKQAFNKEF